MSSTPEKAKVFLFYNAVQYEGMMIFGLLQYNYYSIL